jgi:hypothetical protein
MAETSCHIHFPDSNRSNPNEKSNQVSIAGKSYEVCDPPIWKIVGNIFFVQSKLFIFD